MSVDVSPQTRRRLRIAAAKRVLSVGRYVLDVLDERLKQDLADEETSLLGLDKVTDPVLADLWDNDKDAQYDRV